MVTAVTVVTGMVMTGAVMVLLPGPHFQCKFPAPRGVTSPETPTPAELNGAASPAVLLPRADPAGGTVSPSACFRPCLGRLPSLPAARPCVPARRFLPHGEGRRGSPPAPRARPADRLQPCRPPARPSDRTLLPGGGQRIAPSGSSRRKLGAGLGPESGPLARSPGSLWPELVRGLAGVRGRAAGPSGPCVRGPGSAAGKEAEAQPPL